MHRFKGRPRRARFAVILAALMLLSIPLVASQAGAALSLANPPAFGFVNDENGADDQPGQKDPQAICHVDLADVGGAGTANLVNTCSYPSQQPTSAPSDCVLIPRDAFLRVTKVAPSGTTQAFGFKVWSGATEPSTATVST